MGHVNSVLMALSKCPNPTVFQKTLSVNDFYFGSPEWEFPMGHISFVGKLDGDTLNAGAPKVAPKWTLDLMGKHSLDFWLTSEDLPDPNNRVTLNRDGEIVLQYKPNNEEGHKRLIKKLEKLLNEQRACSVHGHECHEGIVRAQSLISVSAFRSPASRIKTAPSVSATIRRRARSIAIAKRTSSTISTSSMRSVFCSSGAVNPALTIMANALRVGDHLLERMNSRRTQMETGRAGSRAVARKDDPGRSKADAVRSSDRRHRCPSETNLEGAGAPGWNQRDRCERQGICDAASRGIVGREDGRDQRSRQQSRRRRRRRMVKPAARPLQSGEPGEHFYEHAFRFDEMFETLILPLRQNREIDLCMDYTEETANDYRPHRYQFRRSTSFWSRESFS